MSGLSRRTRHASEKPMLEGVAPDAPREVIEAAGKAMQRKTHADAGGSDWEFQEVQEAIAEGTQ
jgi:hypothetical protein